MYKKFNQIFEYSTKSNIKAGEGKTSGEYPFYTSSQELTKYIDKAKYQEKSLIFGTGGKPSIHYSDVPFSTSTDCIVAVSKLKNVNPKYVYYYLLGNIQILERGFRGAGLKHISKTYINSIDIPIISIDEQNKICSVLDLTKKTVEKRKQTISLLNALGQSVFLEMFGDPYLNNKKWPLVKISSFVNSIKAGWSIGGESRQRKEGELGVLKVSAVTSGFFRPEEHKAVDKFRIDRNLVHPKKGDILFSRANTKELVAATCVIEQDYNDLFLPDKLWKVILDKNQVQTYYFKYVLSNSGYRRNLARKATGTSGSMLNISQEKFKNHLFPKAPIKDQEKFESITELIVLQKSRLNSSLEQLEMLFKSLLQKAFKGKLEFNEDELEVQEGITNLSWYQGQIESIARNAELIERSKNLLKILNRDSALKSVAAMNKTLQQFHIPTLKKIESLNKLLNRFKVPYLNYISNDEQIEELKSHPALKDLKIEDYYNKSLEEKREEERLKEIEEELTRENDPVLKYISETDLGSAIIGNYKVNFPRFIHESFKGLEFTIKEIISRLRSEHALTGLSEVSVRKDIFRLFKVFIKLEFNQKAFTFQELIDKLREKLFNPTHELLHDFVSDELNKKEDLAQCYYPGIMKEKFPDHYDYLRNLEEKESRMINKLFLVTKNGNS